MKLNKQYGDQLILHFSSNINVDDFIIFFANRLVFLDDGMFIDQYNREVEIGVTNEPLQSHYFMAMDRVFLRKFGKSPIVINREDLTIIVKGKVNYKNLGFEVLNDKFDFERNSPKQTSDKIILINDRRHFLKMEILKAMERDPIYKEKVLKSIEEKKRNLNR